MFVSNDVKPKFRVSRGKESDIRFLGRIRSEINKEFDFLFINSIQGYRILYFYLIKFKVITFGGAGRISEFFGSRYRLRGFQNLRQILHHNFTKIFLPRVARRLAGLIVHTKKAKDLAVNEGYKKPIHCMPFSLHVGRKNVEKTQPKLIKFMVTGSISARSRDYFSLLNVFENLWKRGVKNIELTILSSPKTEYGFRVYRRMKQLHADGHPINYFSGWIREAEFVYHSAKADFLVAPILKDYYGSGEITSVEVESVRMGIPAFYPDWYYVDDEKKDSSIAFASYEHLQQMILSLSENIELVETAKELALENSESFGINNVALELNNFLMGEFENR
ncbi:hypothetical protein N9W88_02605 [Alphaproteobacteria bacterium]|nr:hypothetical protein [Alphaproteobacteria bacterium]